MRREEEHRLEQVLGRTAADRLSTTGPHRSSALGAADWQSIGAHDSNFTVEFDVHEERRRRVSAECEQLRIAAECELLRERNCAMAAQLVETQARLRAMQRERDEYMRQAIVLRHFDEAHLRAAASEPTRDARLIF